MKNIFINTRWKASIIFLLISISLSWPLKFFPEYFNSLFAPINSLTLDIRILLIMWGPGISGIICGFLFRRTKRKYFTLFGDNILLSILFYLTPWSIFGLMLVINDLPGNMSLKSFLLMAVISFFMILGQEIGWRGFLQSILGNLTKLEKWVWIGLLFSVWSIKLEWFNEGVLNYSFMFILTVFGNILLANVLGELAERTKSLLVPMSMHTWILAIFDIPYINTYITAFVSVVVWVILLWKWNKQKDMKYNNRVI